ncbi:MAG: hypothetical protein IJF00_01325 [Bacteroidaceae bacterium]|nr:hypothetical protein [Bacteroidaceae bacterium]
MKQLMLILLLSLPLMLAAQVDDMYFVPKKKNTQTTQSETKQIENARMLTTQERYSNDSMVNGRDEDEYNRRYGKSVDRDEYSYEQESEYSEDEYEEDDIDYRYSSRILRFHSPRRVMLSSPWYWDIVYTSGVDNWIICDDGIYWDLYPTWYYSSWYYPSWSSWGFSFHWNSGWWPHHYCHHPYYPYYHHHHHYNPHWGGHHGGHTIIGGPSFRDNRRPYVANLRTGTLTSGNRRHSTTRGGNASTLKEDGKRGSAGSTVTGNTRRSDDNNQGRARGTVNRERDRSGRTPAVKRSSSGNERNYNRPSSTRSTSRSSNVERSSSSSRSSRETVTRSSTQSTSRSSNVERSSSSSRSSRGAVSRGSGGGSSRGGRR